MTKLKLYSFSHTTVTTTQSYKTNLSNYLQKKMKYKIENDTSRQKNTVSWPALLTFIRWLSLERDRSVTAMSMLLKEFDVVFYRLHSDHPHQSRMFEKNEQHDWRTCPSLRHSGRV